MAHEGLIIGFPGKSGIRLMPGLPDAPETDSPLRDPPSPSPRPPRPPSLIRFGRVGQSTNSAHRPGHTPKKDAGFRCLDFNSIRPHLRGDPLPLSGSSSSVRPVEAPYILKKGSLVRARTPSKVPLSRAETRRPSQGGRPPATRPGRNPRILLLRSFSTWDVYRTNAPHV